MYPILLAVVLAAAVLPKSATVVDSHLPAHYIPIGNVLVTFTDGHSEKWTLRGHAMFPEVSSTGLVGWAILTGHNYRGDPVDSVLRVCCPDGHHRDFSPDLPFIERWRFSDDSKTIVIKSRASHGCANYDEYDVATGKLLGHAHCLFGKDLPAWAQPFSD